MSRKNTLKDDISDIIENMVFLLAEKLKIISLLGQIAWGELMRLMQIVL